MAEINHKQLGTLLERCFQVKRPLFIEGTIGIGKSMAAKEFFRHKAKTFGREFIEWVKTDEEQKSEIQKNLAKFMIFVDERVALKDSTDNKGVPKLGEDYLKWVKTMIMNLSTKKDSMVIWFKDELNLAPPSVQAAEYQIILDRALDDLSFAPNTYVFAAGNRQEDLSNVFEMSMALKNRFNWVTLKVPDVDSWVEWAMNSKLDTRIVTFLQFKPSFLFKMPKANSKENAFPSPRSWHFCSDMIRGIDDIEQLEMFSSSSIGDGVSAEFVAWFKLNRKVNLKEILENPEKIKQYEREIDMVTSIMAGIVDKYSSDKELLEPAVACALQLKNEFAVYMLRLIKSVNSNHFMNVVPTTKYYQTILDKYKKFLT